MSLYFVALIPPQPLQSKIQGYRLHFKEAYNSSHALKSPPHITLLSPFNGQSEKELIAQLNHSLKQRTPFELSLKDFFHFGKRVIFMDVVENTDLLEIQKGLETHARNHPELFRYNYPKRPYHPHLTIAFKDLTEKNFQRAWEVYQNKSFSASFVVDEVYLLKHDSKQWQVIHSFPLRNDQTLSK